jgi:hypothetical protein
LSFIGWWWHDTFALAPLAKAWFFLMTKKSDATCFQGDYLTTMYRIGGFLGIFEKKTQETYRPFCLHLCTPKHLFGTM